MPKFKKKSHNWRPSSVASKLTVVAGLDLPGDILAAFLEEVTSDLRSGGWRRQNSSGQREKHVQAYGSLRKKDIFWGSA